MTTTKKTHKRCRVCCTRKTVAEFYKNRATCIKCVRDSGATRLKSSDFEICERHWGCDLYHVRRKHAKKTVCGRQSRTVECVPRGRQALRNLMDGHECCPDCRGLLVEMFAIVDRMAANSER